MQVVLPHHVVGHHAGAGEHPARPLAVRGRTRFTGNDPFRDEDRAFLDAVRHGDRSRLISRYDDALRTHRLTTSIRALAEAATPRA